MATSISGSRFDYKSTIIAFGGAIQEVLCNPEINIAIFSATKPIAEAFLKQIKEDFENTALLKRVYSDVLDQDPRTLGADGRPGKWGVSRGITVKRKTKPKEATIEAHGLIDGEPTSRHFDLHIYDDMATQDHLSEEASAKRRHAGSSPTTWARTRVRKMDAGHLVSLRQHLSVVMECAR